LNPITTLRTCAAGLRARFSRELSLEYPGRLPLWGAFEETWTEEERIEFVDHWTTSVNDPEDPSRRSYPSTYCDGQHEAWWRDFADHADLGQDRVESGRRLLLSYPTNRKHTIESMCRTLSGEHRGRFSAKIRHGITEFDSNDAYILDLVDEGFIVGDLPWAILRYAYDGDSIARAHYLELKQAVLDAGLTTQEDVLAFLHQLLEAYREREWAYLDRPSGTESKEDWRRLVEDGAVKDRLFEITYPERMVRLSDGTLCPDFGPQVCFPHQDPAG
jgi:hypothetical protein